MCVEYREEVQNKRKMITGETSKLGSCRARLLWFLNAGRRICVCYVGKRSCSITSRRKVWSRSGENDFLGRKNIKTRRFGYCVRVKEYSNILLSRCKDFMFIN